MHYLPEFLTIALLHLLAVISPGADFAMIVRTSLVYSRKNALVAAAGLGIGILLHVTYSLLGLGLIISQSIILFSAIKFLGAAYLLYIGWHALHAKPYAATVEAAENQQKELTNMQSFRLGFLTNALNPKATLLFLAIFTQVIQPSTPVGIKALYGLEMSLATFLWFAAVSLLFSHGTLKVRLLSIRHWIDRVTGVVFVLFGLRLAFAKSR